MRFPAGVSSAVLLGAIGAFGSTAAVAQEAPALGVVLHELAWMGSPASASDEWIELHSNSLVDIDLTGWTLVATDGTPSVTLAGTIPAGGHFLLERTDDSSVPNVAADQIYTGALGNAGEALDLRDGQGTLQDRVDAWYAGHSATRETMQRVDSLVAGTVATNWTDGPVGGTPMNSGSPGGECAAPAHSVSCQIDPPFPFRSGGPLVINEVMSNPAAVADSAGEYVEIFNSGGATVDVAGFTLRDDGSDSFTIPTGAPVPIPPGGFLTIAASANPAANGGFTADLTWTGFFLSNSGDEVVLVDPLGIEQDRLVYSSDPFTGASGASVERVSPRLPTSDPLSWVEASAAFGLGDRGTPGAPNTLQRRHYLLRGTLATMDEELPAVGRVFAGALHVQGNRILDVVAAGDPLPGDAGGAIDLQTGGIVFPGLMNIHDHITFNTLPAWDVPSLMQDVSDWTSLDDYQRHVRYPHTLLTDPDYYGLLPEVGKYTEVKALAAGTTTVQGSFPISASFTQHLARNVDVGNFGADRVRQRALSVLDSTFQSQEAPALVADMDAGQVDAWLVHLAEGTGGDALLEFNVLKDVCLLRSETAIIHGTALTPADLDEVAAAGAKLIVAPTGNYLYYGGTADVPGAVQRGIPVSLSTDWSPAGDKDLLAAVKSLSRINATAWGGVLSDLEIVEMVTTAPARTLNWCNRVGALRAGMFADLLVVAGDGAAPYRALIEATEEDVILTAVDGDPLYGRPGVLESLKPGDFEVVRSGCGFEAGLDVTTDGIPLGDESFAEIAGPLGAASALDFQHMKANFKDPSVAGMTDAEFQAYLDARFPLGLLASSLDPFWVAEDPDYFTHIAGETNVTALDPAVTLDVAPFWDADADGTPNPCEPALLRSTSPQALYLHLVDLGGSFVDDVPGSLSDGRTYFYRIDEHGGPTVTITVEALPDADTVRIHFAP